MNTVLTLTHNKTKMNMEKFEYELNEKNTCLTPCPYTKGMWVGSVVCKSKCKHNLHTDEIAKIVKCGADKAYDGQNAKSVWMRLGITLTGSQEDIEKGLQGDSKTLRTLLENRQYKIEGDTYIPDTCVCEYNDANKTNFEEYQIQFELSRF